MLVGTQALLMTPEFLLVGRSDSLWAETLVGDLVEVPGPGFSPSWRPSKALGCQSADKCVVCNK